MNIPHICICRLVAKSCLCNPMDYSPPGSSVPGISQQEYWSGLLFLPAILLIVLGLHNGEGNGTPLQYCCLENPMDGGAWWAAVHGVVKSQT